MDAQAVGARGGFHLHTHRLRRLRLHRKRQVFPIEGHFVRDGARVSVTRGLRAVRITHFRTGRHAQCHWPRGLPLFRIQSEFVVTCFKHCVGVRRLRCHVRPKHQRHDSTDCYPESTCHRRATIPCRGANSHASRKKLVSTRTIVPPTGKSAVHEI